MVVIRATGVDQVWTVVGFTSIYDSNDNSPDHPKTDDLGEVQVADTKVRT